MSHALDFELDSMQQMRSAYFKRMGARARRLEPLNGMEPTHVSLSLDELVSRMVRSLDVELDEMQRTRRAHFKRLEATARRLEPLRGVEPNNVCKSLDTLVSESTDTFEDSDEEALY